MNHIVLQEIKCYERKEKVLECDSECQKIRKEKEEVVLNFNIPELYVKLIVSKVEWFRNETGLVVITLKDDRTSLFSWSIYVPTHIILFAGAS